MALSDEMREKILDWGISKKLLDNLLRANAKDAADAQDVGVESKDIEDVDAATEDVEEDVASEDATPDTPDADTDLSVSSLAEVVEEVMAYTINISERVKALEAVTKQLAQSDAEKIAQKKAKTPLASLTELLQKSVIGADEARVDGRTSLGKAKPKETAPAAPIYTGIPLIDGFIGNTDKREA